MLTGRRRPDTPNGMLPENLRPGDYWKVLNRGNGEPLKSDASSNLTGIVWMVVAPNETDDGSGFFPPGNLANHTVREHEDGTISVLPGDGSSNSILITGAHGRQYHGYIRGGVWD